MWEADPQSGGQVSSKHLNCRLLRVEKKVVAITSGYEANKLPSRR